MKGIRSFLSLQEELDLEAEPHCIELSSVSPFPRVCMCVNYDFYPAKSSLYSRQSSIFFGSHLMKERFSALKCRK